MTEVISSVLIVSGVGLFIGLFLGVAGEKFAVYVDPKEQEVLDALPGNNCGGCGFPGCSGLATAIAKGEAPVTACPVGGEECANKIAEIMGLSAEGAKKMTAFVKCKGTPARTFDNYEYYGIRDCKMALVAPGSGPKSCKYGCIGFGNCVKVCPFDAIHIIDGIARVDKFACKACNKCVVECPLQLIELVPFDNTVLVGCSSKDKGKDVKTACKVGCIACKICEKTCQYDAIHVVNDVAIVDYDKCTMCGDCVAKCPSKIILKQEVITIDNTKSA